MANDRMRPDEQDTGPGEGRPSDVSDERVRNPGIGEEIRELGPGDMYLMPSGVKHKVLPISGPVQALDVFYPVRDEYR